jgi:hypothetical protein
VKFEVFIVVTVFLVMTSCSLAINMEPADALQMSITIARLYGIINQTTTTSIYMLADKLRGCSIGETFD